MSPPSCTNFVDDGVISGGDSKNDIQIWCEKALLLLGICMLGQVRQGYAMLILMLCAPQI